MKSSENEKAISMKDALRIFWEWRQASISVEVCFFCRPGSSENVRVSIDGVVRLVDSEGIVTIAGDGREMDLDLRGSEIAHARNTASELRKLNPLDPDSILQVKFPDGEICLIFPYRRVGYPVPGRRRAESGAEWMQNMLSSISDENRQAAKFPGRLFKNSVLKTRRDKASKPRMGKHGPPIFPLAAFVLVFVIVVLALTPSSIPKLMIQLGSRRRMSDPAALVWVIPQDGNYYCHGSVLNGRKPGKFMQQANALALGYQPAFDNYCQNGKVVGLGGRGNGLSAYFHTVRQGGEAIFSRLAQISQSWLPQT
jgi:hypothetical protein